MSGDIGCGKTTILIAIEFALFGIIRGQLSGTTLLRHGEKDGSVELCFNVEGKEITIRRELKRSVKGVNQDSGYMIIAGVRHDLTPVELKSKILELIGYPDELLTKSKSLVYRYTVYTAQEEMKHILYEKPEERLDVLRRIFDIDKYKRIKENILNFQKELRTTIANLEGRIEDLEEKKEEQKAYELRIVELEIVKQEINSVLLILRKDYADKELVVKSFEEKIKLQQELNNKLIIKNNLKEQKSRQIQTFTNDIAFVRTQKSTLELELKETGVVDLEALRKLKLELEEKLKLLDDNLQKIRSRDATFREKIANGKEIMNKITSLDNCPTCEQEVKLEYKGLVTGREEKKISDLDANLVKLKELADIRTEDKKLIVEEIKKIDLEINKDQIIKIKQKQLLELQEKEIRVLKEQEAVGLEFKNIEQELILLSEEIKKQANLESEINTAKTIMNESRVKLQEKEIENAKQEQEQKTIVQVKTRLIEEIKKKEEAKKEAEKIKQTKEWMLKYLLNITYLMEKQIMLKIHQEFNETFQEWFNTLIEDENLNVRLDEQFTPVIEQNGYETYLENLSGGEKTSVALAYRLALNKVINDFISTIKTRDLLILDEPTDGFSSEQLDKLREVLDRLNIKQVIMVSHEPKLESYVDHIVRVVKEEHVSRVIG